MARDFRFSGVLTLLFAFVVTHVQAQTAPPTLGQGLAPYAPTQPAPPQPLPSPAPGPSGTAPSSAQATPPAAPGKALPTAPATSPVQAGAAPAARGQGAVLFVAEGLETLLSVPELREKLADALGRDLVSLVDPRAHRADATVWAALGDGVVVLRVTPPHRPEVWRQLPQDALGTDPTATIARAVLEMFWADSFARLDAAEMQDPFCPPGLICVQANRGASWPPYPEVEVLDPWDTSYQRFYGWDPFSYRYPSSAALTAPYPGRRVRAPVYVPDAYYGARYVPPAQGPMQRAPDDYVLNLLVGGGVHGGGAFFRYEVDLLRRFEPFDFGLAFIAGRGQPEPAVKARRAIAAMFQRRYVAQSFELDLGGSFGTFFATFESRKAEVRPYLRGNVTFALEVGETFDMLVQSDLATTFVTVPETGAVEYTLSLGLRHRM